MKHSNHKRKEAEDVEDVKKLFNPEEELEEEEEKENHFTPMTDSAIVAFLNTEISRGIGGTSYGDDASEEIAEGMDYFFGRKPGLSAAIARDPNSSRYVSLDVQDAVESTMAEIMPTFQVDELAHYSADNEADEAEAKIQTDIANYIFFEECDGYMLLQTCLRDALISRNCTAIASWESRKVVSYERVKNVHPIAIDAVLQPKKEGEEVTIEEQEGELITLGSTVDDEGNEASIEVEVFSLLIKRVSEVGKPVIEAVAPEKIVISGDQDSPVLYDARFIAREHIVTQSYLIELGIDPKVVETLGDYNTNTEEQSRSRTPAEFDYFSTNRSVRHIKINECYAFLDVDGDGIAERRRMVVADSVLLFNDPVNSYDLVGGTTTATAHKYKGLSLFDKLRDVQDAKTPVMRSIIDGTRLAANPRTGVMDKYVNMDDWITSRTGGTVRMTRADAVIPLPSGEIPQSTYTFLDMMDRQRRERGGSAIDMASTVQSMDNAAEGTVSRAISSMELANALLAKTFGETLIRGIFVQLHQVLRENYKGEKTAKIRGNWVSTVPSEWKDRTAVVVSVGASASERQRQKNTMIEIINSQTALQAAGSVMFSEQKMYQAIVKSVSLSGIKNAESYYVNPESPEGQQASQGQQQQQQEMKQKEEMLAQAMAKAQQDIANAELMKGQASLQSQQYKLEVESLKIQNAEMKTLLDANAKTIDQEFKYEELEVKEALELTKLEVKANRDLSLQNQDNKNGA